MEETPNFVDYRGRPFSRSSTGGGGWSSSSFIIGVEIAERFAFYGIASTMIMYMTGPLGKTTAVAAAQVNAWSGTAAMLPFLGAVLADYFLGRYRTILLASVLYLLGLSMLTLTAFFAPKCMSKDCHDNHSESTEVCFFFAIYLVALGQGLHKPSAQAFAVDQFDENDPSKSSLFNWWYCGIALGTTAALVIVNYVQDTFGWGFGFGVPIVAMVVALVMVLVGSRRYRYYVIASENSFTKVARNLVGCMMKRKNVSCSLGENVVESRGSVELTEQAPPSCGNNRPRLSRLESKGVLRLFPIFATCLVYPIVMAQTATLFTKQASTLDGNIGHHFKVPPASLLTFITVTIVIFIAIYDRILIPLARKVTGIHSGITMLQRIGIGQLISVVSMVISALVEMKRLKIVRDSGLVNKPQATLPMSLWWLVPQYVIIGISDVFMMVGMQEFFYDQAPDELKSFGLAIYFGVMGIGSFASSILVTVIDKLSKRSGESWFSNNLNHAHIDYFYWLLAFLNVLELILFMYFAKSFQYKGKVGLVGS